MGRNIFLREQRTGIIVTLLSISSGAENAEGRKTEKRIELGGGDGGGDGVGGGGRGGGFALGTRYIDRSYAMLPQWRGVLGR